MAKKVQKAEEAKPQSVLTITDISPKGIKAIFGGVRLNWVFVASPKIDKNDELKAQYRLQAILGAGEKEFVQTLKKACEQYLRSASVAWGADVRQKVLATSFALDGHGSFFKSSEHGLTIGAHSTVRRASTADTFAAKFPPKLILADGSTPSLEDAEREFVSGIYADVAVFVSAYDVDGGRGLTVYLNGVRKLADGEPLAGLPDPFAGSTPTALPAALSAPAKKLALL